MSYPFKYVPPPGLAGYNMPPAPVPRTLHIYYTSAFSQKKMTITASDALTPLYSVTHRSSLDFLSSKPHMSIARVEPSTHKTEIGTITFHSFSSSIDITIHARPLTLDRLSSLSHERTWSSPATRTNLVWAYDSAWSSSMTCSDEASGQWLARYSPSHMSVSKGGSLELASPAVQGALLDEVVVTGLAVLQERRRRKQRGGSSGEGGGGMGGGGHSGGGMGGGDWGDGGGGLGDCGGGGGDGGGGGGGGGDGGGGGG